LFSVQTDIAAKRKVVKLFGGRNIGPDSRALTSFSLVQPKVVPDTGNIPPSAVLYVWHHRLCNTGWSPIHMTDQKDGHTDDLW